MVAEGSNAMLNVEKPEDLDQEALARFALDMFHRLIVHYTLWFTEVEHQFGVPKALEIMKVAQKNSYNIQMNRFAKVLGVEMKDGIPKPVLDMPREALMNLVNKEYYDE